LSKPVLVIGGGGHASVLVEMLKQLKYPIAAIISPEIDETRKVLQGIKHQLKDDAVLSYDCKEVVLINGIGSLPGNSLLRIDVFKRFKKLGYTFLTLVSPHAIVSQYAELGEGVQVMPSAVIQPGTIVGANSIINTAVSIEHDCTIGMHNHIAPGAVICGEVVTAEKVHIGPGAVVIQSVKIAENSVVGAGAYLTKNIEENNIVYPCKVIIKKFNGKFT